ncbi:unnamed protein product [Vitrella brassicaformis CCMP3155]|uniref:Protein kinase domain-containing protein n=1 Tax=Vitrella brassicaformis (strain CCMP3155) TaxID=1169540 RepID=A0A0G4H865_VITBC|nr:unnamed protein product [Vitrella brassicaformis CCMP3155]|eukprot:CEM40092.1 unnamed protein product [Vitrella brassicaformis CCMP3155]
MGLLSLQSGPNTIFSFQLQVKNGFLLLRRWTLASRKWINLNFKPSNIMLVQSSLENGSLLRAVVTDLAYVTTSPNTLGVIGDREYMPPEVLFGDDYDESVNVWVVAPLSGQRGEKEEFQRVAEAYEVLSNHDTRAKYDFIAARQARHHSTGMPWYKTPEAKEARRRAKEKHARVAQERAEHEAHVEEKKRKDREADDRAKEVSRYLRGRHALGRDDTPALAIQSPIPRPRPRLQTTSTIPRQQGHVLIPQQQQQQYPYKRQTGKAVRRAKEIAASILYLPIHLLLGLRTSSIHQFRQNGAGMGIYRGAAHKAYWLSSGAPFRHIPTKARLVLADEGAVGLAVALNHAVFNGQRIGVKVGGAVNKQLYPYRLPGLTDVEQLASGDNHTVALSRGVLYVWGANDFSQLTFPQPPATGPTDRAAFDAALFPTRRTTHQLGLGREADIRRVWACGNATFVAAVLAANDGKRHYGCGSNSCGEVGIGTKTNTVDRLMEIPALYDKDVVSLCGGQFHTMALIRDGSVMTWGKGENTGLDVSNRLVDVTVPCSMRVEADIRRVWACGNATFVAAVLAANDGKRHYGCGSNSCGEVGIGTKTNTVDRLMEIPALYDKDVVSLCGGQFHTMALIRDGSVMTWGKGENTGLDVSNRLVDVTVPCSMRVEGVRFLSVGAGRTHTVAWGLVGADLCEEGMAGDVWAKRTSEW